MEYVECAEMEAYDHFALLQRVLLMCLHFEGLTKDPFF